LHKAANREFMALMSKDQQASFRNEIEEKGNFIAEDLEKFKTEFSKKISKDFIPTSSRWKMMYEVHEQLELQKMFPKARLAVLLEGPTGKGKSKLCCELLRSLQYHQFKDSQEILDSKEEKLDYCFIEVNLTKELVADPAWLLKAFDKGCKVILNESNSQISFPLLNDLLTGVTPNNEPATHPGFFLMATQNSVSDGCQFGLSFDLMNRYQVVDVPEDNDDDYKAIIHHTLPTAPSDIQENILLGFKNQKSNPQVTTDTLFKGMFYLKNKKSNLDIETDSKPSILPGLTEL
jgi:hypothetical protein